MHNLTIVIPFYNGHRSIQKVIASIPRSIETIVVDDLSEHQVQINETGVRVLRPPEKAYFSGAVNLAIAACTTDVLVLNQDVTLTGKDWLDVIERNRGRYAMIGERVKGVHPAWPAGYIHGTFMFMRRDAIQKVGGLNGRDFPLWGSTADWQARICRAGFEALPLTSIPGFQHQRKPKERFGEAIQQVLQQEPEKRDLFIRTPPLVSVIVPCYNYGRYLREAIASLIGGKTGLGDHPGQTFQAFEAIIVDDASTDETEKIGRELASHWTGIRYIRRSTRGGTSAAMNTGIKHAFGRAVTALSADDLFHKDRLETLYRIWDKDPGKVIYDDLQIFSGGHLGSVMPMQEYNFDRLVNKNQMHSGIFFARSAWAEVGGYPTEMKYGREDWAFNVRLGLGGYCGQRVPQTLYYYRREGQNRTERNAGKEWRTYFQIQMRALFPQAYRLEDRPMSCCGSRAANTAALMGVVMSNQKPPLPGADGMNLIRYVGRSLGTQSFYGPVSGARYSAGRSRPLIYVDNRDLRTRNMRQPGLLELREEGQPVFALEEAVPDPVPQVDALAVNGGLIDGAAAVAEVEYVSTETPAEPEETFDLDVPDLLTMTARDLISHLQGAGYAPEILRAIREAEAGGRGRTTVLNAIEALLNG